LDLNKDKKAVFFRSYSFFSRDNSKTKQYAAKQKSGHCVQKRPHFPIQKNLEISQKVSRNRIFSGGKKVVVLYIKDHFLRH